MNLLRKPFTFNNPAWLCALALPLIGASQSLAQTLSIRPLKPSAIYDLGERAGWTLSRATGAAAGKCAYVVRKNNLEPLKSGEIDLSAGPATIALSLDEPAMLYLQVTPANANDPKSRAVAGAAIAPTKLQPVAPRPADFDSFWSARIAALQQIPENPVLTPKDAGNPDIDYAVIRMDHLNGGHVYGQIAKPKHAGKFPALVIFQWASPPYPLDKSWVTTHAAQGFLTLNIEPHDVLPDQPKSYYDALPKELKNYQSIGQDDRDKSYFLKMYLADYRAVDYITHRDDWDGKTLVVMGTSMGGQQSLCVAGLHPAITHLIVNEPAGCDLNASLHGRQMGYPFFPANDPKVMETARYFDAINFAAHIHATSLVAMGFVDTTAPPAGIWTAYNQIQGPKEAVPMIDSPHNNLATPEQQHPFNTESAKWLDALVKGEPVKPVPIRPPDATSEKQSFDDHADMMRQLGLKTLRPGPNPRDQSTFNEATANPYKNTMPDALTMNDGTKVTRPEQWPARRAEIVEDFEREVYGRIPPDVPKVTWEITQTTHGHSGAVPTITKTLVGHVDNSAYPQITVDIQANFTVPENATAPVPMMLAFGFPPGFFRGRNIPARAPQGTPWTNQAIAHGWGYGTLVPTSIQPDNNHLTTQGIIALTNKGHPRTPDQWGALRAWAWGVSQLVDYFDSHPDAHVDPTRVGIEGVSRYGKAALVTEAFDPRIAVGFIASSGEGGSKLHRHIFGEAVENLAGGEYYWMAGNFMKYGAADPPKTAADLPVDSHELLALCAPRPCFISHGVVEHGDAKWIDAHGSFMAGVLASKVYQLLGKKGFNTPGDYLTDPMPPVGQLIGGQFAWRQHDGGHDATPNWPTFFTWIDRYIPTTPPPAADVRGRTRFSGSEDTPSPAQPIERTDPISQQAHRDLLNKARQGNVDLYFLGDSITRRWGCADPQYTDLLANWHKNFHGYNAGDFGWGGDTVANILWRVRNGELDNVHPKVIVLLAGTNDVGPHPSDPATVGRVVTGIQTLLATCQAKAPSAQIILTAIFPRNDNLAALPTINAINEQLATLADGKTIRFLNVNDKLADPTGRLFEGMMNPHDQLHPTVHGYQVWADGLKPLLTELLGPPAKTDHAPPPTADPSIAAHAGTQHR